MRDGMSVSWVGADVYILGICVDRISDSHGSEGCDRRCAW